MMNSSSALRCGGSREKRRPSSGIRPVCHTMVAQLLPGYRYMAWCLARVRDRAYECRKSFSRPAWRVTFSEQANRARTLVLCGVSLPGVASLRADLCP
jgi:hypothetical protein